MSINAQSQRSIKILLNLSAGLEETGRTLPRRCCEIVPTSATPLPPAPRPSASCRGATADRA
jgi:hypothetical protein